MNDLEIRARNAYGAYLGATDLESLLRQWRALSDDRRSAWLNVVRSLVPARRPLDSEDAYAVGRTDMRLLVIQKLRTILNAHLTSDGFERTIRVFTDDLESIK